MRDFLPADVRRRQFAIRIISDIYEKYGFEPLETPAVENLETLMGKYGEEGNQLVFRVLKRGADLQRALDVPDGDRELADLALRYDLTVPLARVVANYRGQLPKFFKRYQIQPVWRADRPARGRFREFYQCDVDVLGSTSPTVEAELCGAAAEALTKLGFADFTIRINHRQLLTALLDVAGVPGEHHGDALVALDKLDKIGADGVSAEMAQRGIEAGAATTALGLFGERHSATGEARAALAAVFEQSAAAASAFANVEQLMTLATATPAAGHLLFDTSLARGLSYYTGAIMEINVPDLAGSLGGGGRYDNLVGMFLGQQVPACGFSLGLERIIVVMTERGMFPAEIEATHADVLVAQWNAESAADTLALARELRAAGLRVDVYPDADKLGKQFKYAGDRNVPFVVVVGDEERARGEVTVKNLRTSEQVRVPRAEAPPLLRGQVPGTGTGDGAESRPPGAKRG
jgi:histidyl-tRNA synthetase